MLLEDPVQALGQDVSLLVAFTALLPALGHLFHAIEGASDGPGHGGNGVRVPTERDGVDESPLEAVEGRGDLGVGIHAAQEAIDGGGHRLEGGNAVPCGEATIWVPDPYSWAPWCPQVSCHLSQVNPLGFKLGWD